MVIDELALADESSPSGVGGGDPAANAGSWARPSAHTAPSETRTARTVERNNLLI
jgi:hypothetical protein